LRPPSAPARAASASGDLPMAAIGLILLFVIGIGALNYFEFGRLD
jgi:hypothetical protein